jgi:large subunit ribosomal protein L21
MYAIVKTGGKQYRVQEGQSLLVERLPDDDGSTVTLEPLLGVDGETIVEGAEGVTVRARILGHERGPKLRVVKFKPKRGYKRRNGHRQALTRIEITSVKLSGGKGGTSERSTSPAPVAADAPTAANETSEAENGA